MAVRKYKPTSNGRRNMSDQWHRGGASESQQPV